MCCKDPAGARRVGSRWESLLRTADFSSTCPLTWDYYSQSFHSISSETFLKTCKIFFFLFFFFNSRTGYLVSECSFSNCTVCTWKKECQKHLGLFRFLSSETRKSHRYKVSTWETFSGIVSLTLEYSVRPSVLTLVSRCWHRPGGILHCRGPELLARKPKMFCPSRYD